MIERNPPSPGGVLVSKSRTGRKKTIPEEPPTKFIDFGGAPSGGVLSGGRGPSLKNHPQN